MKIYVASSWRNEYQQTIVSLLRDHGHEVYDFKNPTDGNKGFHWSNIDPNWLNWTPQQYKEALSHPIAIDGFNRDFDAMKWADVCVMVLPCGRSANTEAGWMEGAGKKVFVYLPIPQEPELMYKIYDDVIIDSESLLNALNELDQANKPIPFLKLFEKVCDQNFEPKEDILFYLEHGTSYRFDSKVYRYLVEGYGVSNVIDILDSIDEMVENDLCKKIN